MAYHSGTAGVLGWCCGTPAILWHSWLHFPLILIVATHYNIFRTLRWNGCSLYNRRAGNTMSTPKEQKIQKIVDLMNECNDIPLLDLIEKLLRKSV